MQSYQFLDTATSASRAHLMMCASHAMTPGPVEQALPASFVTSWPPVLSLAHVQSVVGVMPNKLAKQTLSTNPADHSFRLYKERG